MENDFWSLENLNVPHELEADDKARSDCEKNYKVSKRIITKQINEALELFKTSNERKLKKEYLRVAVLRRFKKLLKKISSGNYYKYKLHKGTKSGEVKTNKNFLELVEMIKCSLNVFESLIVPDNTPVQDFAVLQKKDQIKFKTYNNKYLKSFFGCEETKRCYHYFINLIFADSSLSTLCKILNIKCCSSVNHTDDCYIKWNKLQNILLFDIFVDIGIKPWKPSIDDDLKPSNLAHHSDFFELSELALGNEEEVSINH